jgi:hypothetical protein
MARIQIEKTTAETRFINNGAICQHYIYDGAIYFGQVRRSVLLLFLD